jgi:NAD-dependent DNA ligase
VNGKTVVLTGTVTGMQRKDAEAKKPGKAGNTLDGISSGEKKPSPGVPMKKVTPRKK